MKYSYEVRLLKLSDASDLWGQIGQLDELVNSLGGFGWRLMSVQPLGSDLLVVMEQRQEDKPATWYNPDMTNMVTTVPVELRERARVELERRMQGEDG